MRNFANTIINSAEKQNNNLYTNTICVSVTMGMVTNDDSVYQ